MPLALLRRSWSSVTMAAGGRLNAMPRRPSPLVLLVALQVALLLGAYTWFKWQPGGNTPCMFCMGGRGGGTRSWPVTSNLSEWAVAPDSFTYKPPHSQCLLHPDGEPQACCGYLPGSAALPPPLPATTAPNRRRPLLLSPPMLQAWWS